jgi:DNA gyrase subunit B
MHESDCNLIKSWLENLSYLCPGLTLYFGQGRNETEVEWQEFKQDKGLVALVDKRLGENTKLADFFVIQSERIEVVLAWTQANGESWEAFVNTSPTPDGGTHVTGARKAITRTLKERAWEDVYGDDLRDGLYAAIHYKTADPLFQGQTKVKLLNSEADSEVYELLVAALNKFWDTNVDFANLLINRAIEMAKARAHYKKRKDAIRKIQVSKRKKGILPGKLAEAPFCEVSARELYICEGQSAGGSAKQARNATYQEVLPLRGKVINSARQELTTLLKNEELKSIAMAIGGGIADECSPDKARIGKVLLLMDADADGHHIEALVLTFLVMHMRPIVAAGLVYVVDSPLFVGIYKQKRIYGHTKEEVQDSLGGKGFITRLKGHGEASAEELREYAFAETRKLLKVTLTDEDDKVILNLMGDDVSQRRIVLGI